MKLNIKKILTFTASLMLVLFTSLNANARPRDCTADFKATAMNGNVNYISNIDFGDVTGIFGAKQRKCLALAEAHCKKLNNDYNISSWLKNTYPNGFADACKKGIKIYIDTTVEGKKRSKDGSCDFKPAC